MTNVPVRYPALTYVYGPTSFLVSGVRTTVSVKTVLESEYNKFERELAEFMRGPPQSHS